MHREFLLAETGFNKKLDINHEIINDMLKQNEIPDRRRTVPDQEASFIYIITYGI